MTNISSKIIFKKAGIFRKFLVSFLAISILPLLVLGIITLYSIKEAGENIIDNVADLVEIDTQKKLELQAATIADNIENFLRKCEHDLNTLSDLPRDFQSYLNFSLNRKSEVWYKENMDGIEKEIKEFIPVYKEVLFVDKTGIVKIFVKNGKNGLSNSEMDVSLESNTSYKCEKYYEEGILLKQDEIYVSHLNGFYISMQRQLESNSPSKEYDGVIRFVKPVYENGTKKGIVVLAVDHRHIMEFTQHVLPNSDQKVVFPDYNSGDYAFIFDDEGWIITHPKLWDIRGVDANGNIVKAYSANTSPELLKEGYIPFNLDSAGFIHQNYPIVAGMVRHKEIGTVATTNVGGIQKIMAFAPVHYDRSVYTKHGIFGGVTIGTEINKFQLPSAQIKSDISNSINFFVNNFIFVILTASFFSLVIAFLLTKQITQPIIKLTKYSKDLSEGKFEKKITLNRNDEIGILAESFNKMSVELEKGRNQLLFSYRELQTSQKDTENYAADLEYQLKILKSIQSISNIIGSTFDMNTVLNTILRTCVESVNFDRAILYLTDDDGKYLEFKEMYGFLAEEERYAKLSRYHIDHADCIETKVLKTGRVIFVNDFNEYSDATIRDKQIRAIAKSNSFVFVPLRTKEKIIGVLGADKLRTSGTISENDIDLLQILTNQAARVIENTRLYKEIISQRNFVEDIISNMINGVISTNGKGFITSINKAASNILEFNDNNIIGKNIWNLLENAEQIMMQMKESLAKRGIYKEYNVEVELKETKKYLNINASRIYHSGRHTGSIIIIEDVSEKKQLDEEIQKIDRLASLGRFAAGIAHEIRNPLTGLSLFLDDIHDQVLIKNANYSALVSNALSEIERLENLITEILDYAVPSKGRTQKIKIDNLIESTLLFTHKLCKQAGINVSVKYQEKLPDLEVDPEKIKQALLNLIVNSIQFMPDGGDIIIQTKSILFNNNIEKISIRIEDTGKGFDNTDLTKIFDPFYSRREGGTGLGLAITHSIIREHNGTIVASNRKPVGAVIEIFLPTHT